MKASVMTRAVRALTGAAMLAALSSGAQAMSFGEAYSAALANDARYRAAGQDLASAQQDVPLARAALLPQVGISAGENKVLGTRTLPNGLNQDTRLRADYTAPSLSLNLRMPLFNGEAISRYRQAQAQTELAESNYRAQGSDLIDRLATAYLQVLLAEESARLTEAQERALVQQHQQAQQRLQRGEGTRQDEALTRAALDLTRARLLDARDQVRLAQRQLQRITGMPGELLRKVSDSFVPTPLFTERLGDWLDMAYKNSPTLRAREQRVRVAELGVQRQQSGHLPRLDLVASMSRSENDSLNTLNQSASLRSVGLQLNVPLYSGGAVEAGVKQALADKGRSEEELRLERENIAVEVQRYLQGVQSGGARIAANMQAVASAKLALLASERGVANGIGTLNDVADAQTKVFVAERDLAQARFDYVNARTHLMLQSGLPMAEISADMDQMLQATPVANQGTKQP